MARSQVAIRLATEGKAQVQRDFADIADAGSAQVARLRAKWESETAQIGKLTDRAAKTAERLAAASSTPLQQRIGAATGVGSGGDTGAAAASARALAQELDRAEREATQLIAAIDPLFAAQTRYAANVARLNELKKLGVLEGTRFAQLLNAEEQALDNATRAAARNNQMRGTMRMGMQQLSFQAGDVAQQLALGVRGEVIFAQQSGQVIQALQLMGGEGNKFLKFLGGPWGLALAGAAVVLTPFIGKIFAAGEGIDDLVKKLVEQEQKTRLSTAAQLAYDQTVDGSIAKIRALSNEIAAQNRTLEHNIALKKAGIVTGLTNVVSNIGDVSKQLADAVEARRQAERDLLRAESGADAVDATQATANVLAAKQRLDAARQNVATLTGDLQQLSAAAEAGARAVRSVDFPLLEQHAKEAADPIARINREFDDMATKAKAAAAGNDALKKSLGSDLASIEVRREAALKDARASTRTNAGGTAIFDAQIGAFFNTAEKYRGRSEHADRGVLEAFFREANLSLDPEKTAWCAAFVNAVLATNGVKGTGSLAAGSFLNFGKDDTKSPQKGDIVVVKSSGSPSGQHVGLLESIDAKGNVRVLGGNTGDKVSTGVYSKNEILAIRRPPTPSEAAKAGETAADRALAQQNNFEEMRARLNEQLLAALGQQVTGYQAQSDAAALAAHADHETAALKIQNNLEEGKYGEATSESAKARAAELQLLNDAVENQKMANLALRDRLHDAEQADKVAAAEVGYRLEGLQFQDEIARTAGEHRDAQLEILDLVYQEKKRHLEYLKAQAALVGNTEEAARLQAEINNLPAQKERDQERARRGTRSPGEDYLAQLPKTMADLKQALEEIEVKGLEDVNKQLVDAAMNAKSLGDFFGDLKGIFHSVAASILEDLLNLATQMFIMRPLAEALFGQGAGGAQGGGGGGGIWGTIISGIGSALGAVFGGGSVGGSGGGGSPMFGPSNPGVGYATGTHYFPGGAAWVGEHGPEMVTLPRGSRISTAAESRRLAAANDAGPRISLTNHNDFRGADPAAVAAIEQKLNQMEAELPGRVVSAYQDARQRFVIR